MRYEEVKARVDRLKREAAKAEGALEQLMDTVVKDFNCKNLGEAREHLSDLEQQLEDEQESLATALEKFCDKYSNVLEED